MSERIKFEYNIIEFPQGFKKNNIERESLNDLGSRFDCELKNNKYSLVMSYILN